MNTSIEMMSKNGFWQNFFSLFERKQRSVPELSVAEATTKELDQLWSVLKAQKTENPHTSNFEYGQMLMESFRGLKERYSDEELDKVHAWIRYVKLAVHCEKPPTEELVKHVSSENYIYLTKRLSDLARSICKDAEEITSRNMDRFNEAVYRHILATINDKDIPSCLSMGKVAQKRKDYSEARKWFSRVVTETEEPFNGLTSLLACYEEETKEILLSCRKRLVSDERATERVQELNNQAAIIYNEWYGIMKGHINSGEDLSEQYKKKYVAFLTSYARFERNRGRYDKAFDLLQEIPDSFPDMYRVYQETAMIYQFKPYQNQYYSLDRAIEAFEKAYALVCTEKTTDASFVKSKKSILMPLANAYFRSSRYSEADKICDLILKIDKREKKAISLKCQMAHLVL